MTHRASETAVPSSSQNLPKTGFGSPSVGHIRSFITGATEEWQSRADYLPFQRSRPPSQHEIGGSKEMKMVMKAQGRKVTHGFLWPHVVRCACMEKTAMRLRCDSVDEVRWGKGRWAHAEEEGLWGDKQNRKLTGQAVSYFSLSVSVP